MALLLLAAALSGADNSAPRVRSLLVGLNHRLLQHTTFSLRAGDTNARSEALRCVEALFAQDGGAEALLVLADCDASAEDAWAPLVGALCAGVLDGDTAAPRLRACTALLRRQLERPAAAAAPDAWRRLAAARERKATLRAAAAAIVGGAEGAFQRWRQLGLLPAADADGHADAVAEVLFELPGVPPAAAGDYLAGRGDEREAALAAYMQRFDFGGLRLDEGLRLVFAAMGLPGEAQKIDRVVGAFASAYFRDAPGPFADADAAHVAAFSLILLNTDQHNDNVKRKMTIEQFVKNNRGINNGTDLPRPFLEAAYAAVVAEEIVAYDWVPGTPEPPPSAARLRYLSQRRGSIGADAAADRAAGGSDDDGEALDSAEVQRELYGDVAPLTLRLADALLQPTADEPAAAAARLTDGVRALLLCIQLGARHGTEHPSVAAVVAHLCELSTLPAALAATDPRAAAAACCTRRPLCLAAAAIALGRAMPHALDARAWRALIDTSLMLHALGLAPPPIKPADAADDDVATAAAAHLLTGAAAALPAASRTALLHAATSALDAAIPRALRDPHAGALPAAASVALLAELARGLPDGDPAAAWALPAANERVERVLRTYGCPPPVVHAAMRARAVLEQPVASEAVASPAS